MNQKKTPIENIKIKPIAMRQHRTELRRVLLTSSYWDKKQHNIKFYLKGGEEITSMKKFISAGIIVAVMIIATLFVAFSPFPNKKPQTAYAEQVAQKSYQAVSTLTPEQQKALKQKVRMNATDILQEAKNAKDLKIITYDQFVSENPEIAQMPSPPKKQRMQTPDLHNAKFLQFTDKNGAKVIIGVDPNNDLPILVIGQMKKGGDATFRTQKGGMSGLPDAKSGQVGFVTTDGPGEKGNVSISADANGNDPVLTVNGKKYVVPASVTLSPDSPPPSIQVKDDEVYVNGVKATPIN